MASTQRMMRVAGGAALWLSSLTTAAPGQSIWVVDAAGAQGSHCRDLASAVNAARPDDILIVRRGFYAGTTVTKPLKILSSEFAAVTSPLIIKGIPTESQCLIQNLSPALPGQAEVRIVDCDGLIHVQGYVGGQSGTASCSHS